jgi:hypothetical protein
MERGVRQYCKFERRPVQEMVYQLTDTEDLVYSPLMQTITIICKNATSEIVHLDIATKIHAPENCLVKFTKHTITSTITSRISSPPLQFAWAWDPFTLSSTSLDNPQHLDHMVNELRNKIYNVQANISEPINFENMLTISTLTFKSTSIIIWVTLALISKLYLTLMIIAFTYYLKQCKNSQAVAKFSKQEPTNHYEAIQMQPLIQDLGNVLIRLHTANREPTQIRSNP